MMPLLKRRCNVNLADLTPVMGRMPVICEAAATSGIWILFHLSLVDNFAGHGVTGGVWSGKRMSVQLPIRRRSSSFGATGWRDNTALRILDPPSPRLRRDSLLCAARGPYTFLRNEPTVFCNIFRCNNHHTRKLYRKMREEFGGFVLENEPTGRGNLRADGGLCHEIGLVSGETKPPDADAMGYAVADREQHDRPMEEDVNTRQHPNLEGHAPSWPHWQTDATERVPPFGKSGEWRMSRMLAICGRAANLTADFHAPDDSPRFQCSAVWFDIGDPAVGGHSHCFCRFARGPHDGTVGQQFPQLPHAHADGDGCEFLRDHGGRGDDGNHLGRHRPVRGFHLCAGGDDDGDGVAVVAILQPVCDRVGSFDVVPGDRSALRTGQWSSDYGCIRSSSRWG